LRADTESLEDVLNAQVEKVFCRLARKKVFFISWLMG